MRREFGTSLAAQCLNDPGNAQLVLQEAKEALISRDWEIVLEMAKCHQSTKHIADPRIASSWCKLWDIALDHGVCGTRLTTDQEVWFYVNCSSLHLHARNAVFDHVVWTELSYLPQENSHLVTIRPSTNNERLTVCLRAGV